MTEPATASCRWAVIPAAGLGSRFDQLVPKQYQDLLGKTVISRSMEAVLAVDPQLQLVVALAADDSYWPREALASHPRVRSVPGGAERADSVLAGLLALRDQAAADDWVLVHDAARPCVAVEDIQALLQRIQGHAVGGLLATPVVDTLKRVGQAFNVEQTVDRQQLQQAQTPQIFRYGLLIDALQQALQHGRRVTDEASAVEMLGLQPLVSPGRRSNIKITYAEDLWLAQALLAKESQTLQEAGE